MYNNYFCSEMECKYKTSAQTEEEAEQQLKLDGGCDVNKKTFCPHCKKDSLIFIHKGEN